VDIYLGVWLVIALIYWAYLQHRHYKDRRSNLRNVLPKIVVSSPAAHPRFLESNRGGLLDELPDLSGAPRPKRKILR